MIAMADMSLLHPMNSGPPGFITFAPPAIKSSYEFMLTSTSTIKAAVVSFNTIIKPNLPPKVKVFLEFAAVTAKQSTGN